jgi:hypothetical protein
VLAVRAPWHRPNIPGALMSFEGSDRFRKGVINTHGAIRFSDYDVRGSPIDKLAVRPLGSDEVADLDQRPSRQQALRTAKRPPP